MSFMMPVYGFEQRPAQQVICTVRPAAVVVAIENAIDDRRLPHRFGPGGERPWTPVNEWVKGATLNASRDSVESR